MRRLVFIAALLLYLEVVKGVGRNNKCIPDEVVVKRLCKFLCACGDPEGTLAAFEAEARKCNTTNKNAPTKITCEYSATEDNASGSRNETCVGSDSEETKSECKYPTKDYPKEESSKGKKRSRKDEEASGNHIDAIIKSSPNYSVNSSDGLLFTYTERKNVSSEKKPAECKPSTEVQPKNCTAGSFSGPKESSSRSGPFQITVPSCINTCAGECIRIPLTIRSKNDNCEVGVFELLIKTTFSNTSTPTPKEDRKSNETDPSTKCPRACETSSTVSSNTSKQTCSCPSEDKACPTTNPPSDTSNDTCPSPPTKPCSEPSTPDTESSKGNCTSTDSSSDNDACSSNTKSVPRTKPGPTLSKIGPDLNTNSSTSTQRSSDNKTRCFPPRFFRRPFCPVCGPGYRLRQIHKRLIQWSSFLRHMYSAPSNPYGYWPPGINFSHQYRSPRNRSYQYWSLKKWSPNQYTEKHSFSRKFRVNATRNENSPKTEYEIKLKVNKLVAK